MKALTADHCAPLFAFSSSAPRKRYSRGRGGKAAMLGHVPQATIHYTEP